MSGQLCPCPGALPLILVQQTVLRNTVEEQNVNYSCANFTRKDWPLSFRTDFRFRQLFGTTSSSIFGGFGAFAVPVQSGSPAPASPAPSREIILSLSLCESTGPFMVHCKMTVGYTYRSKAGGDRPPSLLSSEALISINAKNKAVDDVVSLQYKEEDPFDLVTVLYRVYDMASTQGASPHLNRARLEGDLCDMRVVVDGTELAAHRTLLAVRSPVLHTMLTGDYVEARQGRLDIVDFSREAIEKFLEFLYTDQIQEWGSSELELLQLGDKYMVPELRRACLVRLYTAEPARALQLLHDAAAGRLNNTLDVAERSRVNSRLVTIVMDNYGILYGTKDWAEFNANFPFAVDVMMGTARSGSRMFEPTMTDLSV